MTAILYSGPPSAKKIKVKNVMDEKAQQKLKKTGVIPEENAKPVDREAQRDNRKKRTKDPEKDKRTIFVGNLTNKITKKVGVRICIEILPHSLNSRIPYVM